MSDIMNYLFPESPKQPDKKPQDGGQGAGGKDRLSPRAAVQPVREQKTVADYETALRDIFSPAPAESAADRPARSGGQPAPAEGAERQAESRDGRSAERGPEAAAPASAKAPQEQQAQTGQADKGAAAGHPDACEPRETGPQKAGQKPGDLIKNEAGTGAAKDGGPAGGDEEKARRDKAAPAGRAARAGTPPKQPVQGAPARRATQDGTELSESAVPAKAEASSKSTASEKTEAAAASAVSAKKAAAAEAGEPTERADAGAGARRPSGRRASAKTGGAGESPADRGAAGSAGPKKGAATGKSAAGKRGGRVSKQPAAKKSRPPKARLAMNVDEYLRRDLVIFNNPVLIGGLAVTPIVAAATTLQNALALCVAVLILVVPTRILGDLVGRHVPMWLRPMLYAFTGAALYIPAYFAVSLLFGEPTMTLAFYLPLLAVDTIVLSRSEIKAREGLLTALRNGVLTSVGFALVACVFGAVREILSQGRLMGIKLLEEAPFRLADTVGGGLILTAVAAALFQTLSAAYRNAHPETAVSGEDENV